MAVALALTVAVVSAGTAGQLVDYGFDLHAAALDSTGGGGLLGAAAEVALVAAAVAAWVLVVQASAVSMNVTPSSTARRRTRLARPPKLAAVGLAALLTFLAFEDVVPVAAMTFVALVVVAQRLQKPSRTLLHVALVLLATGFLLHAGGDSALDLLGVENDGWIYQLKSVIKHDAEAAGWMLVAIGLAAGWRPE